MFIFLFVKYFSVDLMHSVILSSELLVIQVEMDIYTLLKKVCWYYSHAFLP